MFRKYQTTIIALLFIFLVPVLSHADDTEIFGKGTIRVKPNVLVILDTSGSMSGSFRTDYIGNPLHKDYCEWKKTVDKWNKDHGGTDRELNDGNSYETNMIYRAVGVDLDFSQGLDQLDWSEEYAESIDDVVCQDSHDELLNKGYWIGFVDSEENCAVFSFRFRVLATGNYLNFLLMQYQSKMSVAKVVLKDVIDVSGDDINLGLMRFNNDNPWDGDEPYTYVWDGTRHYPNEKPSDMNSLYHSALGIIPKEYGMSVGDVRCREDYFHEKLYTDGHGEKAIFSTDIDFDLLGIHIHRKRSDCVPEKYSKFLDYFSHFETKNYVTYSDAAEKWNSIWDDDGARLLAEIPQYNETDEEREKSNAALKAAIDAISPHGETPLAESLAEAGLYFAGGSGAYGEYQKSWSNPDCYYPLPTDYSTRIANGPEHDDVDGWVYESYNSKKISDPRPSPRKPAIDLKCQENYVIIITDGMPENDEGERYGRNIFNEYGVNDHPYTVHNTLELDNNTESYNISRNNSCLDEIADNLFNNDVLTAGPHAGSENDFEVQRVRTYTVGLDSAVWGSEKNYLEDAAHAGHGKYYPVNSPDDLRSAFDDILRHIYEVSSGFAASVIPVDTSSSLFAGDSIYLPMFQPTFGGRWYGNLKKYAMAPDGTLYGKLGDSTVVDDNGNLMNNAIDLWSLDNEIDSNKNYSMINEGGAGENLFEHDDKNKRTGNKKRNFYYPMDKSSIELSDLAVTVSTKGLNESEIEEKKEQTLAEIFSELEGGGVTESDESTNVVWIMGDIMHSTPAVQTRGSRNIIYVGGNDGALHAFEDNNNGTPNFGEGACRTDDTVKELWSFVPADQLRRIKYLHQSFRTQAGTEDNHLYYMDGTPVLFEPSEGVTNIVFGRRRGGNSYTMLDVTGDTPVHRWTIPDADGDLSTPLGQKLGQSWFDPLVCNMKTAADQQKQVVLLAGGYDPNQDLSNPASVDTRGNVVYCVNASNGNLVSNISASPSKHDSMDHSIVDLTAFDSDGDECIDTIYAPDMGGNLFFFCDRDKDGTWDDNVSDEVDKRHLFSARYGTTEKSQLKFFHSPDVVRMHWGDYVFVGTGDRAHPNTTYENKNGVVQKYDQDRFYAIKNRLATVGPLHEDSSCFDVNGNTPATSESPNGLVDITDCKYGSTSEGYIQNSVYGWYVRLEDTGEMIVSSPITLNGIVYFTTYTPVETNPENPCDTIRNLGVGRLWAIDYLTGKGVYDSFVGDDTADPYEENAVKDKRSKVLGHLFPAQPALVVTKDRAVLAIGSQRLDLDLPKGVIQYYWKQL